MTAFSLDFQNYAFIMQKLFITPVCQYVYRLILKSTHCLTGSDSLRALTLGTQVDLRDQQCALDGKVGLQNSLLHHCL